MPDDGVLFHHVRSIIVFKSRALRGWLVAFCVGVAVGPLFRWISPSVFILGAVFCLTAFSLKMISGKRRAFLLLTVFCLFGIWRFLLTSVPVFPDRLPKTSIIEGIVSGDVERRQDAQAAVIGHVTLNNIVWDWRIKLSAPLYPKMNHGDRVSFSCSLRAPRPINGFRYDRVLASRGIAAECSFPSKLKVVSQFPVSIPRRLLNTKAMFLERLAHVLPEPHASFVSGLLFGGSFSLSPDLKDAFSVAGVSHILAASGFNVSLVTFVFLGFVVRRIGRSWGSAATVLLLLAYVFLAGAVSSMVRAALMASLLLVGMWVRRKADQINVLLLAGCLLLFWNPLLLWGEPGFQLSFGATAALLLVAPVWKSAFAFLPDRFGIRETLVASMAIQAVTFPIILWHFGSVSLVSPLANVFIMPFIPVLFWSGVGTAAVSAFSNFAGQIVAIVPWFLSTTALRFAQIFSQIPPIVVPVFLAKITAIVIPTGFLLWHFKHRAAAKTDGL